LNAHNVAQATFVSARFGIEAAANAGEGSSVLVGVADNVEVLGSVADGLSSVAPVAPVVGGLMSAGVILKQNEMEKKMGSVWTECKKKHKDVTTISASAGLTMSILALSGVALPALAVVGLTNHLVGLTLRHDAVAKFLESKLCSPVHAEYTICITEKGETDPKVVRQCWADAAKKVMDEEDNTMEATLNMWIAGGAITLRQIEDKMLEKLKLGEEFRSACCRSVRSVAVGNDQLGEDLFGGEVNIDDEFDAIENPDPCDYGAGAENLPGLPMGPMPRPMVQGPHGENIEEEPEELSRHPEDESLV